MSYKLDFCKGIQYESTKDLILVGIVGDDNTKGRRGTPDYKEVVE